MRKIAIVLIILLLTSICLIVGCSSGTRYAVDSTSEPVNVHEMNFTDSLGRTVTVNVPATRIVALNSNTGELLADIGAGGTVVGLASPAFTARPWMISRFPNPVPVGSWSDPNCEQILDLKPDVVIAYSSTKNLDRVTAGNVPVLYLDVDNATETIPAIRAMGQITGKTEIAEKLAQFYQKYYDLVETRLSNISEDQKPRIYMEMYSDYVSVMPGSASDHIIRLTGGRNIVQISASGDYPVISKEYIVHENPDVIIRAVNTANLDNNPDIDLKPVYNALISRDGYENIKAVSGKRVYVLTGEMLYGPRSFSGVLALARILHPELFSDIDPQQALDEYAERFMPEAKKGNARIYPVLL